MHSVKRINGDVFWVGGDDKRISLFENVFPVPNGMAYNSYLINDEKTLLLDAVDKAVGRVFFENLTHALQGRPLDYAVINHMEPDHCAVLPELISRYPDMRIVGNAKTAAMIRQFFDFDPDERILKVADGDILNTGRHTFKFIFAPMVHWPEVMTTYDQTDCALYSADAFGSFGAHGGSIFADDAGFKDNPALVAEMRRYYCNIVGKYGAQVQALLKKTQALDIKAVLPLHGPVWRGAEDIGFVIDKHSKWSAYIPEERAVVIAYGSIYGHTENAVNILAGMLNDAGMKNVSLYDVSSTHSSVIVAEAFRADRLVLASPTYNAAIFPPMESLILALKAHNLQNRSVALIENGSWAPTAGGLMKELLSQMKNIRLSGEVLSIKSALNSEKLEELKALAAVIGEQ
ncbi:MAG: FprA family A-type flavoprotein [Clostridiales bacterium]|jgi:flavorubredoxin|nr:FprA family A-type flavoprotein [Clostridiales bacterium]